MLLFIYISIKTCLNKHIFHKKAFSEISTWVKANDLELIFIFSKIETEKLVEEHRTFLGSDKNHEFENKGQVDMQLYLNLARIGKTNWFMIYDTWFMNFSEFHIDSSSLSSANERVPELRNLGRLFWENDEPVAPEALRISKGVWIFWHKNKLTIIYNVLKIPNAVGKDS